MHPKVEQAIQEIDAALFSSDEFDNEQAMAELQRYIDRWESELWSKRMMNSRCHICGGENH